MKKLVLTAAFVAFSAGVASAQDHNTLWCDKDPKVKAKNNVVLRSSAKGEIKVEVNWEGKAGGSTFEQKNLAITNGSCVTCKSLGAIGANHAKETWTIKATDPSKPVGLAWGTPSTKAYCGNGSISIAPSK
jgi:hypothetical protein